MSVRLSVADDSMTIELFGTDMFLALKSRLRIPLEQITDIRPMERSEVPYTRSTWLRAPGGYFPGAFRHGSYGWKPNREFWAAFGNERVLVIDIEDWDYHRVVLSVRDPDGLVASLTKQVDDDAEPSA